jgi:hypothetical protein
MGLRIEKTLKLGHLKHAPVEVAPEALTEAGEVIRAVSVARTPVETGRLAGSATVSLEEVDGDQAVKIHYDGPYARYQHERLDLRHEHGGQAKFLESAMMDEADNALEVLARHIERAL